MSKSYRVRTQVGVDKSVTVNLDQDFDFLVLVDTTGSETETGSETTVSGISVGVETSEVDGVFLTFLTLVVEDVEVSVVIYILIKLIIFLNITHFYNF